MHMTVSGFGYNDPLVGTFLNSPRKLTSQGFHAVFGSDLLTKAG